MHDMQGAYLVNLPVANLTHLLLYSDLNVTTSELCIVTSNCGKLRQLSVSYCVTDFSLATVLRGCSSSLCNVSCCQL